MIGSVEDLVHGRGGEKAGKQKYKRSEKRRASMAVARERYRNSPVDGIVICVEFVFPISNLTADLGCMRFTQANRLRERRNVLPANFLTAFYCGGNMKFNDFLKYTRYVINES